MRPPERPALLHAGATLMLALAFACQVRQSGECSTDPECPTAHACVAATCVPRATGAGERWSVEVSPGAQAQFAPREHADFTFGADPVALAVDRKIGLRAWLEIQNKNDVPADAKTSVHVVVSVPSTIKGREDLAFEADGSNQSPFSPYEVSLSIPARLMETRAMLGVLPNPPQLNRTMPPYMLEVTLAPELTVPLPGASEIYVVDGKLEWATPTGAQYLVRARLDDKTISNAFVTATDGQFKLKIQKSMVGQRIGSVTLELGPADAMQALPTLFVPRVDPARPNLGTVRMPPFRNPEPFAIPVIDAEKKQPVAGATVRFTAQLPGAMGADAAAVYTRVAQTGADGRAMLPLIPGSGGRALEYTVKVTPPKNSEFAAHCEQTYPVLSGEGTRVGASIELPRKVVLSGRVMRWDGLPARAVRVKATRRGDVFNETCGGDLVSPPSEASADAEGRYRLLLDPGEYRIDYEPPPGAALPMAAEEQVLVPGNLGRDVMLPQPVVVEGRVVSPESTAVSDSEVRAFDVNGVGKAFVRGVALSGADGRFRLVLPRR